MSSIPYASILILLGPQDALEGFAKPEFLHSQFFIHCTERDDCTQKFRNHANTVREMDVFLPDTAVDLIYVYNSLTNAKEKRFHLYCETDNLVNQYKTMAQQKICEQVFNTNQIEDKLYTAAHLHLFHCINSLNKRDEEGDVDAGDLVLTISELFLQSATKINENNRRKAGLPEQAAEY